MMSNPHRIAEHRQKAGEDWMSNKPPLISIGMPVYNGEMFVRQAVESLLMQTLGDFELIISDNASTDSTQEICAEFAARDPRIWYIRQETNSGGLANFSFVLQQARGKYFMWAAADDVWDKRWLEALVQNFTQGVRLSFGALVMIGMEGEALKNFPNYLFSENRLIRLIQFYLCEEGNGKANFIYGLYQREFLRNHGLRTLWNDQYGSDMLFVFDVIQGGYLKVDPSVTFYKRIRPMEKSIESKRTFGHYFRSSLLIDAIKYYM
jgi:glycosyltransferase involved in cell wall biosynthesis